MKGNKCTCSICKLIDKLRWATITECQCYCHTEETPSGHTALCCAYPNGQKNKNPHKELQPAEFYTKELYKHEIYD